MSILITTEAISIIYFILPDFFCGSKPDPLDGRSRMSIGMVGVALKTYGLDLGDIGRFEEQFVVFKDVPSVFFPLSQAVTPRADDDVTHLTENRRPARRTHFFRCIPHITDRLRRGEEPAPLIEEDKEPEGRIIYISDRHIRCGGNLINSGSKLDLRVFPRIDFFV